MPNIASPGWKTFDPKSPAYTLSQAEIERARRGSEPENSASGERIPIVKEKFDVGKQQTEERVHVRVEPVERPVEKEVNLRDERVVVECRRAGAQTATDKDLARASLTWWSATRSPSQRSAPK